MSLTELVQAAKELPPQELTALTARLVQMDNVAWDRQLEEDSASGKLDRLFEEAEEERAQSTLRPWPKE